MGSDIGAAILHPSLENIVCLDFEASALGPGSYPIEAALVACETTDGASWLIRPTDKWLSDGIWSEQAFDVHKISLSDLTGRGETAETVARELSTRCSGKMVVCDGGKHDRLWLATLFDAIGESPPFELVDYGEFAQQLAEQFGRRPEIAIMRSELEAMSRFPDLHRAGPDARRLAETIRLIAGRA